MKIDANQSTNLLWKREKTKCMLNCYYGLTAGRPTISIVIIIKLWLTPMINNQPYYEYMISVVDHFIFSMGFGD